MSHQFSIDEIFEIAEQIERNGAKFYREAASTTRDVSHQDLLRGLAFTEDEHERTFAVMRKELVQERRREAVYEGEDLAAQYLWAWADKAVFDMESDPLAILAADANMETILTTAIGREKESIVYYTGLKGGLSVEADRAKVDAIIGEELIHVALLSEHLRILRRVQQS
jgi:rubrerythrin